jgi:hypothetical protein
MEFGTRFLFAVPAQSACVDLIIYASASVFVRPHGDKALAGQANDRTDFAEENPKKAGW